MSPDVAFNSLDNRAFFFYASGRCHKPALMTYVRDVGEDQMSYDINF